jgi:hypothetical protein
MINYSIKSQHLLWRERVAVLTEIFLKFTVLMQLCRQKQTLGVVYITASRLPSELKWNKFPENRQLETFFLVQHLVSCIIHILLQHIVKMVAAGLSTSLDIHE